MSKESTLEILSRRLEDDDTFEKNGISINALNGLMVLGYSCRRAGQDDFFISSFKQIYQGINARSNKIGSPKYHCLFANRKATAFSYLQHILDILNIIIMWGQGQGGFNNGWGGQGGYNQGGGGFINLGGGMNPGACSFNRWGSNGHNYQAMNGFNSVDYSNGWNADYHDQMLRTNIDFVYSRYDSNFSGQLQGNEFFFAYRDLCLRMGIAPPMDYQSVWNAVLQSDNNFNGRVSKMEMFRMFKRIQGINDGNMGMGGGMGMGMGGNMSMGMGMGGGNMGFGW